MPDATTELVPLGLLVAEGFDIGIVARRHADQLVRNGAGLRCLPAPVVASLIDERDRRREAERQERERQAQRLAEVGATGDALRARVRRIQQAQERLELVDSAGEPIAPGQALEHMKLLDGARDRQLARAATERNELLTGRLRYHPIRESQG